MIHTIKNQKSVKSVSEHYTILDKSKFGFTDTGPSTIARFACFKIETPVSLRFV